MTAQRVDDLPLFERNVHLMLENIACDLIVACRSSVGQALEAGRCHLRIAPRPLRRRNPAR